MSDNYKRSYSIQLEKKYVDVFEEIKKHENIEKNVDVFKFLINQGSVHVLGRMLHDNDTKEEKK